MNRFHLTVLSCLVVFGTIGLAASPSRAQDNYMSRPTYVVAAREPVSRYDYAPPRAPTYFAPRYPAPARVYQPVAPRASAWSYDPTGRHDRLARPWLQSSR
jgi:hypothetical protein